VESVSNHVSAAFCSITKICVGVGEERNVRNFESSDGFLFCLDISRGSLCHSITLNPSQTICEGSTAEMGKPSDLEQKMAADSVWWSHATTPLEVLICIITECRISACWRTDSNHNVSDGYRGTVNRDRRFSYCSYKIS